MTDTSAERLRHDIDSGRTGDKVAARDPAAVPLGTDAEAGGHPPRPAEIAKARETETARPSEPVNRPGLGHAWVLVIFSVALAAAIVLWGAFARASSPPPGATAVLSGDSSGVDQVHAAQA